MKLKFAAVAATVALLCASTAALTQPVQTDILLGTRVFPESIASDAAGNLYVGSNGGTIYRVRAGAKQAEPWIMPSAENGLRSLFGVFADEGRKVLWACAIPNMFAQPRQTGTSALKASAGFSRPWPSAAVVAGYGTAFYFLSLALRQIPVGIAYAVWSGVGTVLITLIGVLAFRQKIDAAGVLGIALIVAGVLVLNL